MKNWVLGRNVKKPMNKREQLKNLRMKHLRERNEIRDDEMYTREGEDYRIERIRNEMARILNDPEIDPESRKKSLAHYKEEIEQILDLRDEREHNFIEQELKNHQLEQELEQQIEAEERQQQITQPENQSSNLNILFQARSSLTAGAEQLRKNIEESRRELTEDEQFSTILINSSERDNIPSFKKSRRKKAEEPEQSARIDTIVIKQREIGMMYRESQEQQNILLGKKPTQEQEPDNEFEDE